MQRIIVTGATSMIGVALIEECIKHGTEVYAVVREGSEKRSRLPEGSLIKFVDCSLEHLDRLNAIRFITLPGGIPEKTEIQAQSFKAGISGIL